jgi:hypothetical protein
MEHVVFQPLQTIASALDDDLQGLNGRQHPFFYRTCPYTQVKSEIPGSKLKTIMSTKQDVIG